VVGGWGEKGDHRPKGGGRRGGGGGGGGLPSKPGPAIAKY